MSKNTRPLAPDELVELAGLYLEESNGNQDTARIKMIREVIAAYESNHSRIGIKAANALAANYVRNAAQSPTS